MFLSVLGYYQISSSFLLHVWVRPCLDTNLHFTLNNFFHAIANDCMYLRATRLYPINFYEYIYKIIKLLHEGLLYYVLDKITHTASLYIC